VRRILLSLFTVVLACSSTKEEGPPPYNPNCDDVPNSGYADLRCTGLYTDWATKTLSPDAHPYTPALPLWSDGADKARYLYLPPGAKIDTSSMDEWVFPTGTKVWKEFKLDGKRVETRLFYKQTDKWVWTTYRWSADESRAPRLDSGEKVAGTTFEIPDQVGCDKCHRGRRDRLLGVEAIALGMDGAQGVTLASLVADGRLSNPPSKTKITLPEDQTGKAAAAVGYLHMNCGVSCHVNYSYVEGSESGLFTRISAAALLAGPVAVKDLDIYKTAVGVKATHQQHYTYVQQGYDLITPGNSAKSLVVALASLRDGKEQMPPIGSHLADDVGLAAMKAWIDALPPN
jgi:hypothetical protein